MCEKLFLKYDIYLFIIYYLFISDTYANHKNENTSIHRRYIEEQQLHNTGGSS